MASVPITMNGLVISSNNSSSPVSIIDITSGLNNMTVTSGSVDITRSSLAVSDTLVYNGASGGTISVGEGSSLSINNIIIDMPEDTAEAILTGTGTLDIAGSIEIKRGILVLRGTSISLNSSIVISGGTLSVEGVSSIDGSVVATGNSILRILEGVPKISAITCNGNATVQLVKSATKRSGTSFEVGDLSWMQGTLDMGGDGLVADTLSLSAAIAGGSKILSNGCLTVKNSVTISGNSVDIQGGTSPHSLAILAPLTMDNGVFNFNIDELRTGGQTFINMGGEGTALRVNGTLTQEGTMKVFDGTIEATVRNNGTLELEGELTGDLFNTGNLHVGPSDVDPPPRRLMNIRGLLKNEDTGTIHYKVGGELPAEYDTITSTRAEISGGIVIVPTISTAFNKTSRLVLISSNTTITGQFINQTKNGQVANATIGVTGNTVSLFLEGCAALASCGNCIANIQCGWCQEGTPRCLKQEDCSTKLVRGDTCPVLGSGTDDGLDVIPIVIPIIIILIIIALIIAFIIYKYRGDSDRSILQRKPGPPNFEPIMFGNAIMNARVSKKDTERVKMLQDLKRMLVEDESLKIASAIVDITKATEQDAVAQALVYTFESHEGSLGLIKKFISDEVAGAASESTLFRSNSMASKMLKFYSKLVGLQYLWNTLSNDIFLLMERTKGEEAADFTFELDPVIKPDEEDVRVNKYQLLLTAQKVLSTIIRSLDEVPVEFRVICTHLGREVHNRFPNSKYTAIGGFIFLRFFNPAINLPESYGLSRHPPSKEARRVFVLITKTLQSLSNSIKLGGKEPYMVVLNDFIDENQDGINAFFDDIATMPPQRQEDDDFLPAIIPENIEDIALANVYKQIYMNKSKVRQSLQENGHAVEATQLDQLINNIGDPIELEKKTGTY